MYLYTLVRKKMEIKKERLNCPHATTSEKYTSAAAATQIMKNPLRYEPATAASKTIGSFHLY